MRIHGQKSAPLPSRNEPYHLGDGLINAMGLDIILVFCQVTHANSSKLFRDISAQPRQTRFLQYQKGSCCLPAKMQGLSFRVEIAGINPSLESIDRSSEGKTTKGQPPSHLPKMPPIVPPNPTNPSLFSRIEDLDGLLLLFEVPPCFDGVALLCSAVSSYSIASVVTPQMRLSECNFIRCTTRKNMT